jgi:hypothetical protein
VLSPGELRQLQQFKYREEIQALQLRKMIVDLEKNLRFIWARISNTTSQTTKDTSMKLTSLFVLIGTFAISSSGFGQTTMEEYLYVTKGYKVQIESGLDMKQGYKLEDITESTVTSGDSSYRKTSFKGLFRKGERTPCAIMCIYSNVVDNRLESTDYICIPHVDSSKEIWSMTLTKISEHAGEDANALMLGIMHLSAHYSRR